MKQSKHLDISRTQKPKTVDWFSFLKDDRLRVVIPVGPRFQADVSPWTMPASRNDLSCSDNETDTSKWLGTRIWPVKGVKSSDNQSMIGTGRSEICQCEIPGSIQCVKQHISDQRFQLQYDLGPAFWKWKFDSMGEEVSKLWNQEEKKKLELIVRANAKSDGKSFVKHAVDNFPCQTQERIVSYYLNVYIPRRISSQTRSGRIIVDTDDESEDVFRPRGSRKRCQADGFILKSPRYVKTRYLTRNR